MFGKVNRMTLKEYVGLKVLVYLKEKDEVIKGILKDVDKECIQILTDKDEEYYPEHVLFVSFASIKYIVVYENR
jgi:small nuclear ribonucleoprotein (snRNP)-like protein